MKNKIQHPFFWKIFDKFFFRLLMIQKRHRKEIDSLVQEKLYQLNFLNQNIELLWPPFRKSLDIRYPEYIFSDTIKHVVVIKLDHIGDVFLCKDALISLYKKLPYARFTILSSSVCEAIFRSWGFSEVIACDIFTNEGCASKKILPLENTLQTIRALSPDLAVDLRLDAKESSHILSELRAKITASFHYDSDFHLSEDVVNIFSNRLQLLQLVDRIPIIERPKNAGNGRLIGLAPFATVENKTWNLENWIDLAKKLYARGEQVIFFGHHSKQAMLEKISKECNALVGDFVSIEKYATLVANTCKAYIGHDSGPTHAVALANIPTVELIGGMVNKKQWIAQGPFTLGLGLSVSCSPCFKINECPFFVKCLNKLEIEDVLLGIDTVLKMGS